jgi:hypothetical protein
VFEIMRALHRVLLDQGLRERMKERSYLQAGKFSWEKSVRRILEVYRQVGGAGSGEQPSPRSPSSEAEKLSSGVA